MILLKKYLFDCVCMLRCVQLSDPRDYIACQPPLSIGFSTQEYWSGLLFPPPGNLVLNSCLLHWQADSLTLSHLGSCYLMALGLNCSPGALQSLCHAGSLVVALRILFFFFFFCSIWDLYSSLTKYCSQVPRIGSVEF